ncbi:LacI family DNA-binding transcriptional regulator [Pontiellaceae bacterium B1224]|nr:LacI family DNA-binding transcriptional regulator [Pontiellaceae bacterium B1224]
MNQHSENGTRRRVTQADIAKALGVSVMTVSMAMRNKSTVSKETCMRVQRKAEELGYRPDPQLSALNRYRTNSDGQPVHSALAWLNTWDPPEKLRSFHVFDLYWKGAQKTAQNHGYNLEQFRVKDIPLQRLQQILITRNIRGILVPPNQNHAGINLDGFDFSEFAAVRLGRSHQKLNFNFVTTAQMQNTILAFNKIHEKGYQRIGFAGMYMDGQTMGAGFLWAQQQVPQNRRLPPFLVKRIGPSSSWKNDLKIWLDNYRPDAILTYFAVIPEMLNELGYRVPEDIAVAATSVIDTAIDAGIDENAVEIGRAGVLALTSLLNDGQRGIPEVLHEHLIEGRWVDGSMLPEKR